MGASKSPPPKTTVWARVITPFYTVCFYERSGGLSCYFSAVQKSKTYQIEY
jgi:hypothetical protein